MARRTLAIVTTKLFPMDHQVEDANFAVQRLLPVRPEVHQDQHRAATEWFYRGLPQKESKSIGLHPAESVNGRQNPGRIQTMRTRQQKISTPH